MKKYVLIATVGVTLGLGGLFIYMKEPLYREAPTQALVINGEHEIIPAGYKKYQNTKYGFSILYHEALSQKEIDEGGNASTIVFQNPEEGKGFQIFVVPYNGEQVSEERFRQDIPSGVREKTEEIIVSGAKGVAFYSQDPFLGDTREVWILHGGYLYELTTFKAYEAELQTVLQTWRFLRS